MQRITICIGIVLALFCSSVNLRAQYSPDRIDSILVLADSLRVQWQADSLLVDSLSVAWGFPLIDTLADGTIACAYWIIDSVPVYMIPYSANAVETISTDKVWSGGGAGYTLDGVGITIGLWDIGSPLLEHQEFGGRAVWKDQAPIDYGSNGHPTKVAGVMIAEGVETGVEGMAPEAIVWAYNTADDLSELGQASTDGVLLSNHSYGASFGWALLPATGGGTQWYWTGTKVVGAWTSEDREYGRYSDRAYDFDRVAFQSPYNVIVQASGNERGEGPGSAPSGGHRHWHDIGTVYTDVHDWNDGGAGGFDCIPLVGVAKNVVTVGAVDDIPGGYSESGDVILGSYYDKGSSTGPTDDGRIKPDIVANGVDLKMAHTEYPHTETDLYDIESGTSFAAPGVTGSLALLMQLYRDEYPSQPPPLASTWKALLIHTADESGSNAGPDYKFGWGLMNTLSAAELLTSHGEECCHIGEYTLFPGSDNTKGELEFEVESDGTEPLKVTIAWTDPAFADYNKNDPPVDYYEKTLINDLDLTVTGPVGGSSATRYPWKLDRTSPASAATNVSANHIDNVEQVVIEEPSSGTYIVKVTYDGSFGDLFRQYTDGSMETGSQRLSMIVTGNATNSSNLTLTQQFENQTTRYQSEGTITTQTTFDVVTNSDVTLVAGEKITIKDGSRIREGNNFHAYICDESDGEGAFDKLTPPRQIIAGAAPKGEDYALLTSFPNPAVAVATVRYRLAQEGPVSIVLVNEAGITMTEIVSSGEHAAGTFDAELDLSAIPEGAYYVRMNLSGRQLTQKILVVR